MQSRLYRLQYHAIKWQYLLMELLLVLAIVSMFALPASATKRLQERSLFINSSEAGALTYYKLSFRYMSDLPIGSVELLFCTDPIPYHACVTPPGMDVASANLTDQYAEAGFSISERSTNRLVLSRTANVPGDERASYTIDNIVNPVDTERAFALRMKTFQSTNATGNQVDFGSVRAQVTEGVKIITQVPPMLIFCLAEQVEYNCTSTNENYYKDMGTLSPSSTLTASSEMAVGTNASAGFAIIAVGAPLSAGTSTIQSLSEPAPSQPGQSQFGINLVENSLPSIGKNPEGEWANAVVTDRYSRADNYTFNSGDLVASSPNVSLMKKFTVSYIVNSSPSLRAGVYTTTINFIASGRF